MKFYTLRTVIHRSERNGVEASRKLLRLRERHASNAKLMRSLRYGYDGIEGVFQDGDITVTVS